MRPRFPTLVLGVLNLGARCPYCRSRFVRASREVYEGEAARLLRLTAYRCRDCMRHFAVPAYARPASETASTYTCPGCGGQRTVDSARGPGGRLHLLFGSKAQRCLSCRQRFVALDTRQFLATLVLLGAALAGVVLATNVAQGALARMLARPGQVTTHR